MWAASFPAHDAQTSLRVATLDVSGRGRAHVRDLGELVTQALED